MTIASQCVQSHCLHVHMVPGHALPVTVCVFMQLLSGRVVILLLLFLSGDIETNPGPVGHLTLEDLSEVRGALYEARSKWYHIGIELKLSVGTLNAIRSEYSDKNDCLTEMCSHWLKRAHPHPSWVALTKALERPHVGEGHLAQQLRDKYCRVGEEVIPHVYPTPVSSPPAASPTSQVPLGVYESHHFPPQVYHTWTTPQAQFFTSPSSVPAQPHPSHPPLGPGTYYHPPATSYPTSTPFIPPHTAGIAGPATPAMHPTYSQLALVPPGPTPSTPVPPTSVPAQPTIPQLATLHTIQSVATSQPPVATDLVPPFSPIIDPLGGTPSTSEASTVTTPPSPTHTAPLERQVHVKTQVKTLQTKFRKIATRAVDTIQEMSLDVEKFRLRFLQLDVSQRHEYQQFIQCYFIELKPGTTVENLLGHLSTHWDFFNYGLLEHVIDTFEIVQLKQDMEDYVDELRAFRVSTKLCDFIDNWPVRGQKPPKSDLKHLVIKMDKKWEDCTLEDIEMFTETLTHKFFLPNFVLLLREAEEGCVCLTWYVPAPITKILQENLLSIETEFFKTHVIQRVTIDGEECFPTPLKFASYLKGVYTSKPVESSLPTDKPLPFSLAKIERKEVNPVLQPSVHKLSSMLLETQQLGDTLHMTSTSGYQKKVHIESYTPKATQTPFTSSLEVGLDFPIPAGAQKSVLQPPVHELSSMFPETQPLGGTLHTTSTSGYQKKDIESYTPKTTLTPFTSSLEVGLDFPTFAEKFVEQKCVDNVTVPPKLLPSLEQYLSKADVEADPSLPTKYRNYLSSTPAIRAAMYTPFNAKMSAEVFAWSQLTESPPPTTMTELLTTFTLKTLVGYLSTHPLYCKQQLKVTSFSDLPLDVYKQFLSLCRMAYEGILNRQQLVFSPAHLPTGFSPLSLMQEVPQVYTQGKASSCHFTHLTLQEFLSAIYISQLPKEEQTQVIQDHLDSGHLKMTLRFLAGLTNIPPEITRKRGRDNNVTLLHWLFECKDTSVTTRTLGSDRMVVRSHYSWTPLDYYVTGYVISHSNCPWRLFFMNSSIDDEKFELFCQGCATPGGAGCEGYISYADFSGNDITSKHMQSFVSISPRILQDMTWLDLSSNKLDGSGCDLLMKVVPSMSRLEELLLRYNPIGSGGAVEVIKSLCGSGVKRLWLNNTGIGRPDCEALSKLLQSTHSLEQLHIDKNNLSSESVASIITGLSHNSSLTDLDISNSHFSMANTLHLSSLLREHSKCTLTSLELRDCHISSGAAVELAAALCKNTTLTELDLSGNPIGDHVEGVAAIATLLMENKSLTMLWLQDCHISGQGAGELAAALYKNSTLKYLNLNHNPIVWREPPPCRTCYSTTHH